VIPFCQFDWRRELVMTGRRIGGQRHLFYEFHLDEVVPDDHLVRKVDAVLDLSWVHAELAPHYSRIGRPSIDPVLMVRMLIVGYVFAIRSERQLCQEVQVKRTESLSVNSRRGRTAIGSDYGPDRTSVGPRAPPIGCRHCAFFSALFSQRIVSGSEIGGPKATSENHDITSP
jgi:hypothetical protein